VLAVPVQLFVLRLGDGRRYASYFDYWAMGSAGTTRAPYILNGHKK